MFLDDFVLFGSPQAENFAISKFLFTFFHVSEAISLIIQRNFSRSTKNSTWSLEMEKNTGGSVRAVMTKNDARRRGDRQNLTLVGSRDL